ncbi:hypothetical protein FBZ90_11237 [Nitrospirillum pindoramense]|uniref:Uncharacterized protein n=1 Tax=Nitrospirillum amazonense TaxID=28077 RepID=A0A560GY82_9PROT|nr:hypothetical protein FBZ90_11237 [Nitrospirillum amazonense]
MSVTKQGRRLRHYDAVPRRRPKFVPLSVPDVVPLSVPDVVPLSVLVSASGC